VKLAAKVKLATTPEQSGALLDTLKRTNEICNSISGEAWKAQAFQQFAIHKLAYYSAKEKSGLTSQILVRAISKVADAYKLDKKTQRTYRPTGSIAYDDRILRWHVGEGFVSIWSTVGRLRIPFVGGERQLEQLRTRKGEADLLLQDGEFYLVATCDVTDEPMAIPTEFLGVDLGIANIAADSDGNRYSGSEVKSVRQRQRRLRKKLQKKVTTSANRRLKKLAGKEARFARHTNHVISKQIVATAKGTGRGISVEQLTGIRDRVKVRHGQRVVLHSWAFLQLKSFVLYKAALAGVLVVQVDPRNSSRECSQCGHIDKANRPSQSKFSCQRCGFTAHADLNAARVLSGRASVNTPNAAASISGPTRKAVAFHATVVYSGQAATLYSYHDAL
jgi:putative transposase